MVIEVGRRGQCRTPYNAEKQYPLSRLAQGGFSGHRSVFDTTNRKICDTLKKDRRTVSLFRRNLSYILKVLFVGNAVPGVPTAEGGNSPPTAGTMLAHRTRRNAGDGVPYA